MPTFESMALELFTERLHLRPWRPSDAEAHRVLWTERDSRSVRVIDGDGRPTVEDLRRWIADESDQRIESGIGLLAVERLVEAGVIGYCGLIVGNASIEEPEIAYEFARRVHGHGYATEAARAAAAAASATGRSRLWATVRVWNTASFRVLDKLAFHNSGRVTLDPERGDTIWMTRQL